jgi:hypothetical protein
MPVVHASICPLRLDPERVPDAVGHALDQLTDSSPEALFVIVPGVTGTTKLGLVSDDVSDLAVRIETGARTEAIPVRSLSHYSGPGEALLRRMAAAMPGARVIVAATAHLDLRVHFEFGRAAGRVLETDGTPTAVACGVELSKGPHAARTPAGWFAERYRRAVESWDVRWLVNADAAVRRRAGESAAPQTALLMGILSWYDIQTRVLAYEAQGGEGGLVASIDVLGPRGKRRAGGVV